MLHFAHSRKEKPKSEWHGLDQHLHSTAERAERFAAPFATEWGRLAGLWHDAGKYQKAFQDYLAATGDHTGPKIDHSSVGALIAWEKRAAALAFVVAGHHGGLANKQDLRDRMNNKRGLLDAARESGLPPSLENLTKPAGKHRNCGRAAAPSAGGEGLQRQWTAGAKFGVRVLDRYGDVGGFPVAAVEGDRGGPR
jgi:CRISPR-associated endonuclease Cas3-HD